MLFTIIEGGKGKKEKINIRAVMLENFRFGGDIGGEKKVKIPRKTLCNWEVKDASANVVFSILGDEP